MKTGKKLKKNVLHIDWDLETSKKGGFSHYMLEEIFDEPQTVRQAMQIPKEQIIAMAEMFADSTRSYMMGVGTTYYVASISQYYFSTLADCYSALSSDEFSVVDIKKGDMVLAISQSGVKHMILKLLWSTPKKVVRKPQQ